MEKLYFIHFSDTHIGPSPDYRLNGIDTLRCAENAVRAINSFPVPLDFVFHGGDVAYNPDEAAYSLAARTLNKLEYPLYAVTGNHDRSDFLRNYLKLGPREDLLDAAGLVCYRFDLKGYRFLALDGRGPDNISAHGQLSTDQLEIIKMEVRQGTKPLVVFLHFNPVKMNSLWLDNCMDLVNGAELHAVLLPAHERIRGVFFGHIHQHISVTLDGINYISCGSTCWPLRAWPDKADHEEDLISLRSYNLVTLLPDRTIVQQFSIPPI